MNASVVHSSVIMIAKFFEKINQNTCFESTCSTSGAVRLRGPYGEKRTARQPIRTRDSEGNRTGKKIKNDYSKNRGIDSLVVRRQEKIKNQETPRHVCKYLIDQPSIYQLNECAINLQRFFSCLQCLQ